MQEAESKFKQWKQAWKQGCRRLKDLTMPTRKKRREQLLHLSTQVTVLHEMLGRANQAIADSQNTMDQVFHQIANLQSQTLAEIGNQTLAQNNLHAATQQQMNQAVTEIRLLNDQQQELQAQLQKKQGQFERLYQDLGSIKTTFMDLGQDTNLRFSRFEQELRTIPDWNAKISELEQRLAATESQAAILAQELERERQRIDQQNQRLDQQSQLQSQPQPEPQPQFQAQPQPEQPAQPQPEPQPEPQPVAAPSHNPESNKAQILQAVEMARKAADQRASRFCNESYDYYSQLKEDHQFIYLEVKSVPRSGLHYLQRTLNGLFGRALSFCEWYQEPGCCKQMPCKVTGFAQCCGQRDQPVVRMIKSHDFDLADPIFPTNHVLQRLVLIREPIYSLTSYWSLNVLEHNRNLLQSHGISTVKLNYLHETPALDMAYRLVDERGSLPSESQLRSWLERNQRYMVQFIEKWGKHVPASNIVRYPTINQWLVGWMENQKSKLSADTIDRYEQWKQVNSQKFICRSNPFTSKSQRLTKHLHKYAKLFQDYAERVVRDDSTGLFASCCVDSENTPADDVSVINGQSLKKAS